jgi:hypothetical protein
MKYPNDPDLSSISREQAINLLLASIGYEEAALAQLVKTEAELLQMVLGKYLVNGNEKDGPLVQSVDDLLRINHSVNNTLKTISKKERILLAKLKEVVHLIEVDKCPCECLEPGNSCECSVNITTNLNTTITLTGDNVFFPGTVQNVVIDVPCNCNAANSLISFLVRYVIGGVSIPGDFVEGTIFTSCDSNGATIQGSVVIAGGFYNVTVQANTNGTATATFVGASSFTLTLSGADVVISNCSNTF